MNVFIILFIFIGVALVAMSLYWFLARRAVEQAKAQGAWLTRELERPDARIEVVEMWSDEQMEKHDRELANTILEKVGAELCADESAEATRLRAFLAKIRHKDADGELQTPRDFAVAWFACLQVEDREPASDLTRVFKALNEAWSATRDGRPHISDADQRIASKAIAATLVQSGSPP